MQLSLFHIVFALSLAWGCLAAAEDTLLSPRQTDTGDGRLQRRLKVPKLRKLDHDDRRILVGTAVLGAEATGLVIAGQRYGWNYGFNSPKQRDLVEGRSQPQPSKQIVTRRFKITKEQANKAIGLWLAGATIATAGVAYNNAHLLPYTGPAKDQQPKVRSQQADDVQQKRSELTHETKVEARGRFGALKSAIAKHDYTKKAQAFELTAGVLGAAQLPLAYSMYQKAHNDYVNKIQQQPKP
ncbi:hypothetical protein OC834_001145 [Tilletia horrida]|nr:hypothetical protein OC834_001145 [Tilletia horrida]